jgi:adenylate kinase
MRLIIVTGTPGTGKTTFSKGLSNSLGYYYLDLSDLMKKKGLCSEFDEKRDCWVIDTLKLSLIFKDFLKDLSINLPQGLVIDSHLSQFLGLSVDACFVTTVNIRILKKRLESRGYSSEKVRENLDAEIFDVCYNDCIELGYNPILIDSDVSDYDFKALYELARKVCVNKI